MHAIASAVNVNLTMVLLMIGLWLCMVCLIDLTLLRSNLEGLNQIVHT